MKPTFHVPLWLALSLLVLHVFVGSARGATEGDAAAGIDSTESAVLECYFAVAAADKAGADVSLLLDRLFEAGQFLSLAEVAFQAGDFDSAFSNASQSQVLLSGLVEEAEALEEYAFSENYLSLLTDVLILVVGTAAVIAGSVVVWVLLKRRSVGGGG